MFIDYRRYFIFFFFFFSSRRRHTRFDCDWSSHVCSYDLGAIAGLLEFAAFTTLARALHEDTVVMKPITVTVDYMRGGEDRDTFASATVERLGARIAKIGRASCRERV